MLIAIVTKNSDCSSKASTRATTGRMSSLTKCCCLCRWRSPQQQLRCTLRQLMCLMLKAVAEVGLHLHVWGEV